MHYSFRDGRSKRRLPYAAVPLQGLAGVLLQSAPVHSSLPRKTVQTGQEGDAWFSPSTDVQTDEWVPSRSSQVTQFSRFQRYCEHGGFMSLTCFCPPCLLQLEDQR